MKKRKLKVGVLRVACGAKSCLDCRFQYAGHCTIWDEPCTQLMSNYWGRCQSCLDAEVKR